jgi:hypothetical protein
MTWKEAAYLLLTVVGFVSVTWFNTQHVITTGVPLWNIVYFYAQGSTTPAAASMAWDVSVVGFAYILFAALEGARLKMKWTWIFVAIPFVHSVAFAMPLFLLFRERHLRAAARAGAAPTA